MKRFGWFGALLLGAALVFAPGVARADTLLDTIMQIVPPLLLSYDQPAAPGDGYIWQPGYWAADAGRYSWVPGEWVLPPQTGDVWTPGYWASDGAGYSWSPGYWAPQVGYYGGIDYGNGYYGNGYVGGRWDGNVYRYNTAVTRVGPRVRNVYVDRRVVIDRRIRTGYNGPHGVRTQPTPWQRAFARERHRGMTTVQLHHRQNAIRDPHMRYHNTVRPAPVHPPRRLSPPRPPHRTVHSPQQHAAHPPQQHASHPPQQHVARPPQQHAAPRHRPAPASHGPQHPTRSPGHPHHHG